MSEREPGWYWAFYSGRRDLGWPVDEWMCVHVGQPGATYDEASGLDFASFNEWGPRIPTPSEGPPPLPAGWTREDITWTDMDGVSETYAEYRSKRCELTVFADGTVITKGLSLQATELAAVLAHHLGSKL